MKYNYIVPFLEKHITNAVYNEETKRYDYDYNIEFKKDIIVFYNIFNVLLTVDKKVPILLDTELEDLIQDYFRTHKDQTSTSIPYADTTQIRVYEPRIRKR